MVFTGLTAAIIQVATKHSSVGSVQRYIDQSPAIKLTIANALCKAAGSRKGGDGTAGGGGEGDGGEGAGAGDEAAPSLSSSRVGGGGGASSFTKMSGGGGGQSSFFPTDGKRRYSDAFEGKQIRPATPKATPTTTIRVSPTMNMSFKGAVFHGPVKILSVQDPSANSKFNPDDVGEDEEEEPFFNDAEDELTFTQEF